MKFLSLPERSHKPRASGLTVAIDNGVPLRLYQDVITSHGEFIDLIKLGWGTSIVTKDLERKRIFAAANKIPVFMGGTLFEKAVLQDKVEEYKQMCRSLQLEYVEISNGTIELSNKDKAEYIADFAQEFVVLSEVGYKDAGRSDELAPEQWIEFIEQDLEAGATQVFLEARESGKSGICHASGELRDGLLTEILLSRVPSNRLIFEAPNKSLQASFIRKLGPNVNLANIAFNDIIGVETLRLGLRSETLRCFEPTRIAIPLTKKSSDEHYRARKQQGEQHDALESGVPYLLEKTQSQPSAD